MSVSNQIENVFQAINDLCHDLESEGFVAKAALQVEANVNSPNRQPTHILQRFFTQIQTVMEQTTKDEMEHIQIKADRKEIERRISAFMAYKRMEVDEINVQEFCNRLTANEEIENSCARVDAVLVKRNGSNSHIKMSRVINQWGPQTVPHMTESNEHPKCDEAVSNPVEERVTNMEQHLGLKSEKKNSRKIFERLKNLEDRILFLEGMSPDYFQSNTPKSKRQKLQTVNKLKSSQETISLNDIDCRIASLKKSLKYQNK